MPSSRVSARCRRSTNILAGTASRARRAKCSRGSASTMSGSTATSARSRAGWKMRVAMARVLLGKPDVLLMDEPTNHLDIESIVWLENFLKTMPGALLMTSHDRDFMNRVVTRVADIDDGEITRYSGNYEFYERERALRAANREAAFARQQAMLAKEQRFIDRFAANAAKAGQVQSRVKALEKIEKIELPKRRPVVEFEFKPPPRSGDDVVAVRDLHKAYGKRVLYDGFDSTVRRGERWAVMGRNGAGKTTLLKMIAGVLTPDAGEVKLGASLKLGYFAQQALQVLDANLTVWEQMQQDFPRDRRRAPQPARRLSVLGRRDPQAGARAVGRRADAPGHRAHAVRPAELPRARRADQSPRSDDEGHAD